MGALLTDFTLIKPGSLHRANGGYLLIDARKLLIQPFAWDALKRALKNDRITIESPSDYAGAFSTVTLSPEPIPLNVKVVIFGDHMLYYLLSSQDPEFAEFFKVEAEFDDVLKSDRAAETQYAAWIGNLARCNEVRPLDPPGVAAVIEHSRRMAADAERLSLRSERLADLLREADYWAARAGHDLIGADDITNAIEGKKRRSDRIRERQMESIEREIVMIDTGGAQVGQINGLSGPAASVRYQPLARPTRVITRIHQGWSGSSVIDIEREVDLGGSLHSKGVLILSGFLASRPLRAGHAPAPLSAPAWCSSSLMVVLMATAPHPPSSMRMLSSLSGVPIQAVALPSPARSTSYGDVQAIGGANEKIEGFFDICEARGLTGEQGVLIPRSNVQHLMLRQDVVDACGRGRFHIYPIDTIDQGIEILTGVPAGQRAADGKFPAGTINRMVEERLVALAQARKRFGARGAKDDTEDDDNNAAGR